MGRSKRPYIPSSVEEIRRIQGMSPGVAAFWDRPVSIADLPEKEYFSFEAQRLVEGDLSWSETEKIFHEEGWQALSADELASSRIFRKIFEREWDHTKKEAQDLEGLQFNGYWTEDLSVVRLRQEWARQWLLSKSQSGSLPLLLEAAAELDSEALYQEAESLCNQKRRVGRGWDLREWTRSQIGERATSWIKLLEKHKGHYISHALCDIAKTYDRSGMTDTKSQLAYIKGLVRRGAGEKAYNDFFYAEREGLSLDNILFCDAFKNMCAAGVFEEGSTKDLLRASARSLGDRIFAFWDEDEGTIGTKVQEAIRSQENPLEDLRPLFRAEGEERRMVEISSAGPLQSWLEVSPEEAGSRLREVVRNAAGNMIKGGAPYGGLSESLVRDFVMYSPARKKRFVSRY